MILPDKLYLQIFGANDEHIKDDEDNSLYEHKMSYNRLVNKYNSLDRFGKDASEAKNIITNFLPPLEKRINALEKVGL